MSADTCWPSILSWNSRASPLFLSGSGICAATPVALFVLGVTVALRPFGRVPWEVPGVISVKLLIHPFA